MMPLVATEETVREYITKYCGNFVNDTRHFLHHLRSMAMSQMRGADVFGKIPKNRSQLKQINWPMSPVLE